MPDNFEARHQRHHKQSAKDPAQCQRADQTDEDQARVKPELVTH